MQNNPLHSVVVCLRVTEAGILPTTHGHLLHAAFMDMLRLVNPEPAAELHDANQRKPFTLSPLRQIGHGKRGQIPLKTGQSCWFRATFLDEALLHDFTRYFLQGHTTLRLGKTNFVITEIHTTTAGHSLARMTTTSALWSQWALTAPEQKHQEIALRFVSPTAFSFRGSNRNMYVLPDPALFFHALAGYWDDLAGDDQQTAVQTFAAENVAISYHDIKTVMLRFPNNPQIGFIGDVTFKILNETNIEIIRHLNRLADLAFFTGVGSKTPMGMGQVDRQSAKTKKRDG